jgi:hypothetical protein
MFERNAWALHCVARGMALRHWWDTTNSPKLFLAAEKKQRPRSPANNRMAAVAAVLDTSNGTQERKGTAGLGKLLISVRARLLSLRSVKGADGGSTLVVSWLPGWSPPGVSLVRRGDNNRRRRAEAERAAGGDGPTEARSAGAVTPRDGWDAGIGARAALQRLTVDVGAARVVRRAPLRQLHG